MRIENYQPDYKWFAPISGQATNVKEGALVGKLVTSPSTQNGHLELYQGNTVLANAFGILRELHTASGNDVDVAGTTYNLPDLGNNVTASDPSKVSVHPVEPIVPFRVVRIQYSFASADLIAATQAVSTTTITLTSLENNIAAGFLYVFSGTGAGQINYLTASASGSATLKAAFGTNLDTTSKLIKILPRFHLLISFTSDGTKLSSQAAAGAMQGVVVETRLLDNQRSKILNPATDSTLTGLNNRASLQFECDVILRTSMPYNAA